MAEETNSVRNSNHELIVSLSELSKGKLKGFIAIHNTFLGPALGGTRVMEYSNEQAALDDVLKLSESMTYKCVISGLPFGGGKGVIIDDPKRTGFEESLILYAEAVNSLKGKFYTGEDVGLTEEHVKYMLGFSPYFIGKPEQAGDPSKYAALSAFNALKLATYSVFNTKDLSGRSVSIKGVGKTGSEFLRLVLEEGMSAFIADVDEERVELMKEMYPGVKVVSPETVHAASVDIFSPCALGGDLNADSIHEIKAKIVVGTANNQLAERQFERQLVDQGILYIPDFVANAGGLINVASELLPGGYERKNVDFYLTKLDSTTKFIIKEAKEKGITLLDMTDRLVSDYLKVNA